MTSVGGMATAVPPFKRRSYASENIEEFVRACVNLRTYEASYDSS